jgi:ESCRT-I complex subunit VPS28
MFIQYVTECNKLISQFRVAEKLALEKKPNTNHTSTETFMQIYQMECPLASHRLLVAGVPEIMSTANTSTSAKRAGITVAETAEHFITTMDALKLNTKAVDDLQPLLSDLMNALTRLPETPNDFEPNRIVQQWLQKLNLMRAIDDIDEADSRQLSLDLDSAYQDFKNYLSDMNNQ